MCCNSELSRGDSILLECLKLPFEPLNLKRVPGNGWVKDVLCDNTNLLKVMWRAQWIAWGVFASIGVMSAVLLAGLTIGVAAAGGSSALLLQGSLVGGALAAVKGASMGFKVAVMASSAVAISLSAAGVGSIVATIAFQCSSIPAFIAAVNPTGFVAKSIDYFRVKAFRLPSAMPATA